MNYALLITDYTITNKAAAPLQVLSSRIHNRNKRFESMPCELARFKYEIHVCVSFEQYQKGKGKSMGCVRPNLTLHKSTFCS